MGAIALSGMMATGATAQDGSEAEGFPLPVNTAYCEPGYLGPFDGCTPWEGVVVTFADADDPLWTRTCETVAYDRTASCVVEVPFGSTVIASIMPSTIPDGYMLQGENAVEYTIPDGPPEGEFGGPSFVLFAAEQPAVEAVVGEETIADDAVVTEAPVDVDDTGSDALVTALPSTGVGASSVSTPADALTTTAAALMLGGATALAGGAVAVRRAIR
jgi:hypothetical protein